jgi:hypothetical protein
MLVNAAQLFGAGIAGYNPAKSFDAISEPTKLELMLQLERVFQEITG